jgi:hypothetical protein
MRMLVLAAMAATVPPPRRVDLNHADVERVRSWYAPAKTDASAFYLCTLPNKILDIDRTGACSQD